MKKFFKLTLAFSLPMLLFLLLTLLSPFFMTNKTVNQTLLNLVTYIDAGHGGYDPGTSRDIVLEKDINLSIATKLADLVFESGGRALMSRSGDYDLSKANSSSHKMDDLKRRVEAINSSGANLLISIHVNALKDTSVSGPMVYYRHQDELSRQLASHVQNQLNYETNNQKITHGENYYLFRKTTIPAILIECGFLSNEEERAKLVDRKYQERIAEAINMGILSYWRSLGAL